MATDKKLISIIVPVYNSKHTLEELFKRIQRVFQNLEETFEVIFVDDNSQDSSWDVLKVIQAENQEVKIVRLMKNFGQNNAIICGMQEAKGDFVVTMDDDLQHKPEDIPCLLAKIKQGYDVVFAYPEQKQDTLLKKLGSRMNIFLNTLIFKKPKDLKLSSFRIFSKKVIAQLIKIEIPTPYLSGMIFSITRNASHIRVKHDRRRYGNSNYSVFKLFKLAFNLFFDYSSLPLQILSILGIIVSVFSFLTGLFFIFKKLLFGINVPGWTSVICLLSFFNGLLLLMLSIIGEYLARIIKTLSYKHQFVVRDKIL